MSRELQIRIKTSVDTAGLDTAKQKIRDVKEEAREAQSSIGENLAEIRDGASGTGEGIGANLGGGIEEGAKKRTGKIDFLGLLGRAGPIAAAAMMGKEIGDALAAGIERVHERGLSWDSIMGNYDPRFDEDLIRFREGLNQLREELEKPAEKGLLESLHAVRDAAKEAAAELEHLRELQGIDQGAKDAETDAMRDAEAQAIKDDPNLSPQQKRERLAGLDKQRLFEGAERRDAGRMQEEEAALDQAELQAEVAARAQQAAQEQRARAKEAREAELEAQRKYTLEGNEGLAPDEYLKANRRAGLGSAKEESDMAKKLDAEAEKAAEEAAGAAREAGRVREKNVAEGAADWQETNREIQQVDENLAKQSTPEVGAAAQEAGAAMSEGASTAAGDLRNLAGTVQQGFESINSAISTLAEAQRAANAKAEQAEATARQALEAAQSGSKNNASYNRRL